jgi:small subunit ribosomal protein S9
MNKNDLVYSGIGKRKTSVAKIFLKEGSGIILINNKPFEKSFLSLKEDRELLKTPLILVNLNTFYDIDIKVKGGGINSQLEAVKLGISKAICTINNEYRSILNQQLLLRRDSRIKERRKYGLKKARKASQYSKR